MNIYACTCTFYNHVVILIERCLDRQYSEYKVPIQNVHAAHISWHTYMNSVHMLFFDKVDAYGKPERPTPFILTFV